MVGKPKMQNLLGWEVGMEREAGRDYCYSFVLSANDFYLFIYFRFIVLFSEALLEGIFG